jgi:DNA-binding MarR family transcriptional regulator/N-acetylglutamate synthase-like GNAT family acetyltransferase
MARMDAAIASLRRFNRFFTQFVGALDPNFLGTDLTLAEARILFEIAHHPAPVAADIQAALAMDAGFVSRVLARFEARGWIARTRGDEDGRRRPIALTEAGRAAFDQLDQRLDTARALLDATAERSFTLRTFRPGDMGLIAARQSLLYRTVYGWSERIEIIEGEVTTAFLRDFKPGREQCWVAEVEGVMAGSVFLTDEGEGRSRLRLLYVEPFARGLGIGRALVETCVAFARAAGYREMTLWTHKILESARRIYDGQGFTIVEAHVHEEFGHPVESETWALTLS